MRLLPIVGLICMINSSAIASDDQKLTPLVTAFMDASYSNLSAAYFCRNNIGVNLYLKIRKAVEAALIKVSGNVDFARQTLDDWEKKMEHTPIYDNPHITGDQCLDLFNERRPKLLSSYNALMDALQHH